MGKNAKKNKLVPEDDQQFARFWDSYPHRVAKKEARKAWFDLDPSVVLVDQMLVTLAWQIALWERTGYGTPYPASWLRAERWKDEPPRVTGSMATGRMQNVKDWYEQAG